MKILRRFIIKYLVLAGREWGFDFYDCILFTLLIISISLELHLSTLMLSYALSASIIAAAVVGGLLAPIIGWRDAFICFSFSPALFVIIIRKKMPESDLWLKNKLNKNNIVPKNL